MKRFTLRTMLAAQAALCAGVFGWAIWTGRVNPCTYELHHPKDGCKEKHSAAYVIVHEYEKLGWLFENASGFQPVSGYAMHNGTIDQVQRDEVRRFGDCKQQVRRAELLSREEAGWRDIEKSEQFREAKRLLAGSLDRWTDADAAEGLKGLLRGDSHDYVESEDGSLAICGE